MLDKSWIRLVSSNIEAVKRDGDSLLVAYKGGKVYQYNGVSEDDFVAIVSAVSPGRVAREVLADKIFCEYTDL